ncbi:MAG: His/Gly/Thr/Pro-type tRNA ligase C-terminal domain-containing protein, partial [Candidatus Hermodarchaeota archaeon]
IEIEPSKIPLVYKTLDKSDKMEDAEFEKYLIDTFQDEIIIQGILKLKDTKSIDELLSKFDNIPEEFYKSEGYLELTNFNLLLNDLNLSKYCTFSSGTVRGLDYYTGIIYEVFDTGKENMRSIFGGGRYDDLLSMFSDEKITGTGFGMGILMFSLFLKTYDLIPIEIREKDYTDTIYIASINDTVSNYALRIAQIIRAEDFPCIVDYRFSNLKNELSRANELGVLIALIIGPKEMEKNEITVRNMKTEEQETIKNNLLIDKIYDIIEDLE